MKEYYIRTLPDSGWRYVRAESPEKAALQCPDWGLVEVHEGALPNPPAWKFQVGWDYQAGKETAVPI